MSPSSNPRLPTLNSRQPRYASSISPSALGTSTGQADPAPANQVRRSREQAINDVQQLLAKLDAPGVSRMLSDIADRSVLLLGRFSQNRKPLLDAIRKALSVPPRRYVPIFLISINRQIAT